ncbi:MAG: carbohydrate porin, partial [Candidatus Binataceae bacterium]
LPASAITGQSSDWLGEVVNNLELRRYNLNKLGISPGVNEVAEGFRNFQGGKRTDETVPASTLDLSLSIHTQELLHLPGGEFYADLEDHEGQNPSTVLVGDLQVFDKLNFAPYLQIFELWYQQKLFDDTVRIKLGKVDANTEFSVITNGLPFINASTQVTPTIFMFPTTPDPMPSANVFFTPNQLFYASFGLYDANRGDHFGDIAGKPYSIQPSRNGALLIGETGLTWNRFPGLQANGDLRLGFWGATGTFKRFDGATQHGARGYYIVADQTLWKPLSSNHERGLRAFVEYGHTDRGVTPIYQNIGGGFTWTGLPGRAYDSLGFSPLYARLSPAYGAPHNYELALEMFYNLQLAPWVSIQPDLQYIVNPGGQYPDALIGTLRLKLAL